MQNSDNSTYFFQRIHHNPNSFLLDSHSHTHAELYFLESGSTTYFIKDSIYVLNPGEFILVPKGVFHHTTNPNSSNIDRILINFDQDDISGKCLNIFLELVDNPHVKIKDVGLTEIKKILQKIEAEETYARPNFKIMQHLYLMQLFVLISRYRDNNYKNDNFTTPLTVVQDAATYITNNYDQDLSLNVLAQKYSLTPGYFSKVFKKYTGTNLTEYICMVRISAAKNLLKTTNLAIVEIASAVGFNDSNYFSLMFKKSTGVSPKKYALTYKETKK